MKVLKKASPISKQNRGDSFKYRIFETNEYIKRFQKLSALDKKFIESKMKSYIYPQLKTEPHYGINIKKLVDCNPEIWRYRLGKFWLFYTIDTVDHLVYLVTIEFRKDAY